MNTAATIPAKPACQRKSPPINLTLSPEVHDLLEVLATAADATRSALVSRLVREEAARLKIGPGESPF